MKASHISTGTPLKKPQDPSSTLTFDVKPLIKIALSLKTSAEFCASTRTLAKLSNSRYKTIKVQINSIIDDDNITGFIDELIDQKAYLHPLAHKVLGKYLKASVAIDQVIRNKVTLADMAAAD